jgi:hypothetical protein
MGCELNPKICYTNFSSVIRKQKEVSMISVDCCNNNNIKH